MKLRAFTLAETLITLGIIGVVAAITIPTLIQQYKKTVWVNQLKADVSTVEQMFQKIMADTGVTDFTQTEFWAYMASEESTNQSTSEKIAKEYLHMPIYVTYEQQVKENWPAGNNTYSGETCKKFAGKGSTWYKKNDKTECIGCRQNVYKLANGALLRMGFFDYPEVENPGSLKKVVAEVTIDVNGEKGPNTFGYDAFGFRIGSNGHLYPDFGKDYAYYYAAKNSGNFSSYYYIKDDVDYCKNGNGRGCGAYLYENSWKMDY